MRGSWDSDVIVSAFAEAAVDPLRWKAALEVAATATESVGAILIPVHSRTPAMPCTDSIAEATEVYIRDGWVHRDERNRALRNLIRAGVATDLDFATSDDLRRHPYYQEFLAPFGLCWSGLVRMQACDELWVLSLQRSIRRGPFTMPEQTKLAALSSNLAGATALAGTLRWARAEAALDAFQMSSTAAILLDRAGKVLRANGAAEQLLGMDVKVEERRLVSYDRNATAALDRSLHQLMWSQNGSSLLPPIALPQRDRRPMLVYPVRLASVTADALASCQAIVVLIDLNARSCPPLEHFRTSFGLTAAEARLAGHLTLGEPLELAADQLGIAKETARAQLRALFAKTGARRQADLVTLLLRFLHC
jgi:DNA-binding CsgD family transcriptional regulator/PAS domain-containing protein